jgi:hypothetical protein
MEQIVVQVKDRYKAKMLIEILSALDFVNVVKTGEQEDEEGQTTLSEQSTDFFSFAGLWADRDISLQSIRQKAWPGNYS